MLLTSLLRRLFTGVSAELRVSDAKQFGQCGGSFRGEILVGAKMGFDDLRCWFLRIIDHGFCVICLWIAATEDTLHRHFEPMRESCDVICVRLAGAVLDS